MFGLLIGEHEKGSIPAYQPCDFVFKVARSAAEVAGFWRLRRQIFCEEQKRFSESDRDD